jgi:hypothetical protein
MNLPIMRITGLLVTILLGNAAWSETPEATAIVKKARCPNWPVMTPPTGPMQSEIESTSCVRAYAAHKISGA